MIWFLRGIAGAFFNKAIRKAQLGTKLHGLALIVDPRDENARKSRNHRDSSGSTVVGYAAASFWSYRRGIGKTSRPFSGAAVTA